MSINTPEKEDLVLSGGFATSSNSARAGFLPICLERVPLAALEGIDIHLRTGDGTGEAFTLFSGNSIKLSEAHRTRLIEGGVKFIYIPMGQQAKFREQTEANLLDVATDPRMAISVRAELVYETSVQLVDELLREPDLLAKSPRLEKVSRAVTMLVLNDPTAFSHLFAASHHDFYTAAHMVNVATWMVPLAYAMGHHDADELNHICQAGLMHDIGKTYIPTEVLNKKGKLSADEWKQIQRHPELGYEHLSKFEGIHPLVLSVTMEHHERMDGSGYPRGVRGAQTHPVSRICAVVDSFDAMTAFRPFKERTTSVAKAMEIIRSETPLKYDPEVVKAWISMVAAAEKVTGPLTTGDDSHPSRRTVERFRINCPARLCLLQENNGEWKEFLGMMVVAHSISRAGIGVLGQKPVQPGEYVRISLNGEGSLKQVNEGVVVRSREYGDGWFEIGVRYGNLAPGSKLPPADETVAA
jgi:HD-GYP domain-containing protein (c-di-GMP phosphodiesterase class II)